jgi:N utilization substance protein B
MGRRRLGRECAFKALYRIDLMGKGIEDALAEVAAEDRDAQAAGFARDLLETVGAHRTELDEKLRVAVPHWDLERLGIVDRSILRLGLAEILYWEWIPEEVSIDEYVEIAKKFGTERSGGFVNAVLDRVAREKSTPRESP